MFFRRLLLTLEMIKFEHSVFALPFALTGALLAWRQLGFPADLLLPKLLGIIVAMVAARSAGMTFNRILDADFDGLNPRTNMRHLPAGLLSPAFAWTFLLLASFIFFLAARQLGQQCLYLAPVALGILFLYSFTKRFTSFSHLILGLCLGIAPAAAWIAVTGSLDPRILWLTLAVTFWTAGFDIIYSCQDYEFDSSLPLFSLPKLLGIAGALLVSRLLHVAMIIFLGILTFSFHLGWLAEIGIAAVASLLIYEQSLVKSDDLSRVDAAFFTMNGYVSVLFFIFWAADVFVFRQA